MVANFSDLGIAHQALALRHVFPGTTAHIKSDCLTWSGKLQPTDAAHTYTVSLRASQGRVPTIIVTEPSLQPDEDGRLPHVYSDGSLCLSRFGQWHPRMLYVDTVLPWTAEWLMFYELWLAVGLWLGDGEDTYDETSQAALLHPYNPPPV